VINYLGRATLGVVMPQIRRDLRLTDQAACLLLAAA
jgi:hypothetical protein